MKLTGLAYDIGFINESVAPWQKVLRNCYMFPLQLEPFAMVPQECKEENK
jgi:hypothetical protein